MPLHPSSLCLWAVLGAFVAGFPAQAAEKPRFKGRPDFHVGEFPFDVVSADMDGDDDLDLLTLNAEGTVSLVLLSEGREAESRQDFRTEKIPIDIVVADLDRGGHPEVVVICAGENKLQVLGTSGAGDLFLLGGQDLAARPVSLSAGDFDGDGFTDVAVVTILPCRLLMMFGNGRGGLTTGATFELDPDPIKVVTLSRGRSGLDEVVVLENQEDQLAVIGYEPDSLSFSVERFDGPLGPLDVSVGDFNGDGQPDLALVGEKVAEVSILIGDEEGGFTRRGSFNLETFPRKVSTGDLDGDGFSDIAVINRLPGISPPYSIATYLRGEDERQSGPGFEFYRVGTYETAENPTGLTLVDVTGDGLADGIVTSETGSSVSLFHNQGGGRLETSDRLPDFRRDTRSPVLRDVTGDGRPDLIMASFLYSEILVYAGIEGGFDLPVSYPSSSFIDEVAVGDVNGDGVPDLVASSFSSARVAVHLGGGQDQLSRSREFGVEQGTTGLLLLDINRDQNDDMISLHQFSSRVMVRLADGSGGFTVSQQVDLNSQYPHDLMAADFDGDGDLDLVALSYTSSMVEIVPGTRSGRFETPYPFQLPSRPVSMALGDVTGDGELDICAVHRYEKSLTILPGNGDAIFGEPRSIALGGEPVYLNLGDVLLRGETDFAVLYLSGSIAVHPSDGAGGFLPPVLAGVGGGEHGLLVQDADGDLLPDLVTNTSVVRNQSLGSDIMALHGTVNVGVGPVSDVLFVNASSGGRERELHTTWEEGVGIVLGAPPEASDQVAYALYAFPGDPQVGAELPGFLGRPAFPFPFSGGRGVIVLSNSFKGNRFLRAGGVPVLSRNLAPEVIEIAPRPGARLHVTLQGVIEDPGSRSKSGVSVTNGIILYVE